MRLRLFGHTVVLDWYVSVPERSERVVPRRKLSDFTQDVPCRLAHRSVVTAAPCCREYVRGRPIWEIHGRPLRQAFDVRNRLKSVAVNPQERQHWAEAVDDEADVAGPPIANVFERLSVDFRLLQCHSELFLCRLFVTGKDSQDESEVLEEILAVEQRLYRRREIRVRRPHGSSHGQDIARQPLRLRLALSDDAVAVGQLYGYVVAFQDASTPKPVGRFTPRRCGRTGRVSASVRPDCEQGDRKPSTVSCFIERWDSVNQLYPQVTIDQKPLLEH